MLCSGRGLVIEVAAHGDEVVADDAKAHPDFHTVISFVTTTVQPMSPLEHADPTFASGSPLLPALERHAGTCARRAESPPT